MQQNDNLTNGYVQEKNSAALGRRSIYRCDAALTFHSLFFDLCRSLPSFTAFSLPFTFHCLLSLPFH